jgi:hypothetical protein
MGKLMLTLKLDAGRATLEDARQRLGLDEGEVDDDFGVVNIDPEQDLYAILVDEQTAERVSGQPDVKGPFANPPIEPFGPPKRKRKG